MTFILRHYVQIGSVYLNQRLLQMMVLHDNQLRTIMQTYAMPNCTFQFILNMY